MKFSHGYYFLLQGPATNASVGMTSVYPAPPSVAEISGSGQIGNGEKVVSFTFENCYVGPIFVDTDRDVRAVVDLVQEKVVLAKLSKLEKCHTHSATLWPCRGNRLV